MLLQDVTTSNCLFLRVIIKGVFHYVCTLLDASVCTVIRYLRIPNLLQPDLILNYEKYTQDKFFNCVYLAKVKLIFGQKIRSYPTMNHVELFRNPSICVTAVIR